MSDDFCDTRIIDKPLEAVWTFLTDFKQAKNWMTGITQMRLLEEGDISVGSKLVFYIRKIERFSRVTAWQPEEKMAIATIQEGVETTHTFTLLPKGSQTEIHLNASCHAEGKGKLVYSIVLMSMRKTTASYLENFKNVIEKAAKP